MAAVQKPGDLIWQSYNDSGLVVLVCLKLEAILTEILAQFCLRQENDVGAAVIGYYMANYPRLPWIGGPSNFTMISNRRYRDILKDRLKMTLGSLIFEVFDKSTTRKSAYPDIAGYPAKTFPLSTDDYEKFEKINNLRSRVIHYGRDTHKKYSDFWLHPMILMKLCRSTII